MEFLRKCLVMMRIKKNLKRKKVWFEKEYLK